MSVIANYSVFIYLLFLTMDTLLADWFSSSQFMTSFREYYNIYIHNYLSQLYNKLITYITAILLWLLWFDCAVHQHLLTNNLILLFYEQGVSPWFASKINRSNLIKRPWILLFFFQWFSNYSCRWNCSWEFVLKNLTSYLRRNHLYGQHKICLKKFNF